MSFLAKIVTHRLIRRTLDLFNESFYSRRPSRRKSLRVGSSVAAELLEFRQLMTAGLVSVDSASGTLSIQGTPYADDVVVAQVGEGIQVDFSTASKTGETRHVSATFAAIDVHAIQFFGADGDDRFINSAAIPVYAVGGAGNDVLTGGYGDDTIVGGPGNDKIFGGDGNDDLFGDFVPDTVTSDSVGSLAAELDASLGLSFSGKDSRNWMGLGERWVRGINSWYFVTPMGEMYSWNTTDRNSATHVATLSPEYFARIDELASAGDVAASTSESHSLAAELDKTYGFTTNTNFSLNWGGLKEKWILGANKQWYYITPDGGLYDWEGGNRGAVTGIKLGMLDPSYYENPLLLQVASDSGNSPISFSAAAELDRHLGLTSNRQYSLNWGGLAEKWIRGTGNIWYYITPAGSLFQWTLGTRSALSGTNLAELGSIYYTNPALLHAAANINVVLPTDGEDEIFGGTGDDFLSGGGAQNQIDGETGNDTVDSNGIDTITNSEQLSGSGSDMEGSDTGEVDPKFVTSGAKWGNQLLGTPAVVTFSFMAMGVRDSSNLDGGWTNVSVDNFMPPGARDEIRRAFNAWSMVANIRFIEIPDMGEPFGGVSGSNIRIGGHGMDGKGNTLAHGYFPNSYRSGVAGDLHFDISENWRIHSLDGNPTTIDVFSVAAHEIGHAIGLAHETQSIALMNPAYNEGIDGLQFDDIRGVQTLYGTFPNNLGGAWSNNGRPTYIAQTGSTLSFVNENGMKTQGYFASATTIVATDWGNLVGTIVGNAIRWHNGDVWTNLGNSVRSDFSGSWSILKANLPTYIHQSGQQLTFVNEFGSTSSGYFISPIQFVATDWGNLIGGYMDGRIVWSNGDVWGDAVDLALPNLTGTWTIGAQPTFVSQSNNVLTLVNENGSTSKAMFLSPSHVVALDWQNLHGTIVGNEIRWNNRTIWTNAPDNTRTDFSGSWSIRGRSTHIFQNSGLLTFVNEKGSTSSGYFISPIHFVAEDWGNLLGGYVDGRIIWSNGDIWYAA